MSSLKRLAAAALTTLSLATGVLAFVPSVAHAQVDPGLNAVNNQIGLSSTDPRLIVARIINISLGLLGVIMLGLFIYAGFLWMTSGGNAEQVERAQKMMRNAVIGAIIILMSWGLTTFIINALIGATGGGGGGGAGGGGGPGGGPLGGGGGATTFQIRSIQPTGSVSIRNIEVRFIFTRDVDATTASSSVHILRASDSIEIPGTVGVDGSVVAFVPEAACPDPNSDRRCFDADTEYIARVSSSLRSSGGLSLVCGGFSPACEARFTSGAIVDTAPPSVTITSPFEGQSVPMDDVISIQSHATDDAGISYVESSVDGSRIGTGSASGTPADTTITVVWDTTGVAEGDKILRSKAFDVDSNSAESAPVTVMVRPRHCFNGTRDEDETDVDCGGASCGACSGGSCTIGATCASGTCSAGVCVEQPVITAVTPNDGREGTLVSISGSNFGTTPGTVIFSNRVAASAPASCAGSGSPTWTPTRIVVSVPIGAIDGPIEIENAAGLIDTTNDARVPILDNFDVNDVAHPGLCAAVPASGLPGTSLELRGVGLGSSSDKVFFNDRLITNFSSWSDSAVGMTAPTFAPATYAVQAEVDGVRSNAVSFRIDERVVTEAPIIDSLSPDRGPIGEYITLQGRHFGSRIGRVFWKQGDGSGVADTDFPAQCSTAFWSDTSVTVKVPRTYRAGLGDSPIVPGAWNVQLERQEAVPVLSNEVPFTVVSGEARPGICAVLPSAGPVGTEVEIIGERFGSAATGLATFSGASGVALPMSIAASDWSSNSITGSVPPGSLTGPVRVSQGTNESNRVQFAVRNCNEDAAICGGTEVCCRTGACSVGGSCPASSPVAEFAWNISTGILPINPRVIEECSPERPASPSPWDGRSGGDRACVNTDIFLRFTTPLNPTTVVYGGASPTVLVFPCDGPAENPCSETGRAPILAPGYPRIGTDGDPRTGTGFIIIRPARSWAGETRYRVILTTGIKSATEVPMLENASRCGTGNAYCFTFGTRADTDTCRIGTVSNVPASSVLNDLGATVGISAVPRSADDICLNLRADAYNWTWAAGDARVEVSSNSESLPGGGTRGLENQTATARGETGTESVPVTASVTQGTETISGRSDISVRLQPPHITAFGPNCDKACLNAAAWAQFNVAMDPTTAVASNVILKKCVNENCNAYESTLDVSGATVRLIPAPGSTDLARTYFVFEPTRAAAGGGVETLLEVGRFYRITLRAGTASGFKGANGLPLTGLNDPDGFSWTFRVKEGDDARCTTASVNVSPMEKIESVVDTRQLFSATPVSGPDSCSSVGTPLISDRRYAWGVEEESRVSFFVNGASDRYVAEGLIDTTPARPPGCSENCTKTGAAGPIGRVAACGNAVVETMDNLYCRSGRTPFGDPCRIMPAGSSAGEECDDATTACDANSCLWKPMVGATCGNNVVDRGEQCDAGPSGSAGCSTTCQLLGARAGGSTCGNNDVASGEACDDGNTNAGDGCSVYCLHEGSSRVLAVCGNGATEPGETCEAPASGAPVPSYCDPNTCLNRGTPACAPGGPVLCCGNAARQLGEDCDDGNTVSRDGCSSACLKEGSSSLYTPPSFCGDGRQTRGEMCESATLGNGVPDATQLAWMYGEGTPDASGRLSSVILASYDEKEGRGTYALQCGQLYEEMCPAGTGLDGNGCCAPRPSLIGQSPSAGALGVCRNILVSGTFDVRMDEGSVETNFVLAQEAAGAACPAGTTLLTRIEDYDPTPGIRGFFHRLWLRLLAWFRPHSAMADVWCVGSARGRLSFEPAGAGTTASFTLERALAANTRYQVLFRGDLDLTNNDTPANRVGIKSSRGVVSDRNFLWDFTTGARLCSVTAVNVRDTDPDSPNLFTKADESHLYTAQIISLQDGVAVALSPVTEYAWSWQPWVASNDDVLEAAAGTAVGTENQSTVRVATPPQNGSSFVQAGIRITRDDANVPSTTGRVVSGSQPAQVLLCENPWPERAYGSFTEVSGHPSLALLGDGAVAQDIRSLGPYFNFSTLYCRDAGDQTSTTDDLPEMTVQPLAISGGDSALGILRQYLLTFDRASLRGDGIGIRVATNPLHLTPSAWYASRGFRGTPEPTTVDGYEAVKDGTTWYVGGVNTADAVGAPVYSQIYIISHNPDARAETKNIAAQFVANFALNANIQSGASNACTYAVASSEHSFDELYRGSDGKLARCTADWECLAKSPDLLCSSFKAKMQRDSKRVVDFQAMTKALETAKGRTGTYPRLQAGSFVPTLSTSRWPSWSAQLQSETGTSFPTDPVNRFLTCGVCSDSGAPCQDTSECGQGQTCNAAATNAGVEPATCWNPGTARYSCPRLNPAVPQSTSRLYQYRSVNAGARYELSTELEGANATRYFPPLLTEIRRCSNVESACLTDSDCRVTNTAGTLISVGTCNGTGGLWRYTNICDGATVYGGGGGVCGDGVIGSTELCEIGDTNPNACTTAEGAAGTELQICDDCRRFINGPDTRCVQNVQCGNGRVDGGETCDDGALNGSYGRCNRTCTGYDAFCGDRRISPGESCDLGPSNGAHCRSGCDAALSCNLSCTGVGPRCGDGDVDASFEDCDGNSQQTDQPICVGGTNINNVCNSDADCPGSTCGSTPSTATCVGVTARRCSNDRLIACTTDTDCGTAGPLESARRCLVYPTARTRTCNDYGSAAPTTQWCRFDTWSACQPVNYCGDGHVDSGEACDDGNTSNNDSCTNSCSTNICGDSFYNPGAEECDLGSANGTRSCTADYGSTCMSCSTSCRQVASSGGYCGNGVKEGSEQCDGSQGLGVCSGDSSRSCSVNSDCLAGQTCNLISCRSLGYDYASQVRCSNYAFQWNPTTGQVHCVNRPGSAPCVICPSGSTTCVPVADSGTASNVWNSEVATLVCKPDRAPGSLCTGSGCYQNRQDILTCAAACSLTGCARCADASGTGIISGQVLDAVNYVFPVPNARVTLLNNGIPVASPSNPTYTDGDGNFSIRTLSTIAQCSNYRIVVDSYVDNPCTGSGATELSCLGLSWSGALGTADEGASGGYWPYTSGNFGVSTFRTSGLGNDTGKIYLVPRVGPGETLVVTQFRGSRSLGAYLQFPTDQAFKQNEIYTSAYVAANSIPPNAFGFDRCNLTAKDGQEPRYAGGVYGCLRSLYWGLQGNRDLNVTPHGEIVCRRTEADGSVSPSCYRNLTGPFVTRFKTGPWNGSGHYSFWLVDLETNAAPPSYQYFAAASATVTIVTQDRIYTVTPPTSASCTPSPNPIPPSQRTTESVAPTWDSSSCGPTSAEAANGVGKFWLVFQENGSTGDVMLSNQLLCRGSSIPNEPSNFDPNLSTPTTGLPAYPLPWPLIWSDCRYAVPR